MKKIIRVPDMHCPNCAMRLEGIEDSLPGIKQIDASYKKQRLVVEFDESVVDETQILAAVEDLGYHPERDCTGLR
ncbi:MAG: heavy-metal-associated domain-containing protein [Anaerolineales bacterium]|nr:heavy-metal-associated domain-containing protein [Anaerolineales bacterium]